MAIDDRSKESVAWSHRSNTMGVRQTTRRRGRGASTMRRMQISLDQDVIGDRQSASGGGGA